MLDSISGASYRSKLWFGQTARNPRIDRPNPEHGKRGNMQRPAPAVIGVIILALGCRSATEPSPVAEAAPVSPDSTALAGGFAWTRATPESQGMCGSIRQLGCSKTLLQLWNGISAAKYNTKRLVVIRNDRIIYDRGGTLAYYVYSATKGLLGGPTLVHAMSKCGVGLTDRAGQWLGHGEGARWETDFPWREITVEHLATHTSGICDYGNSSTVCRDEHPGWQAAFERNKVGGAKYVYPNDAFTIARVEAEQNREPARAPGSILEYSNVAHALLNYVVQRACGLKLTEIYDRYIKQVGMGSPVGVALISTDDGQQFNQATGFARWKAPDGAAVLRLAGRQGIWDNRNIEPVRYWHLLTRTTGNIPAAAAEGWGVVYENNSVNMWTQSLNHRRLSLETFGHDGNHSTIFQNDPLTGTIVARQGETYGSGGGYLTLNGCSPGWTGTAPTCSPGTNYSNNWSSSSVYTGQRKMVMEPLQEAFFFPPPFCRMTSAGGSKVDDVSDEYTTPIDGATVDLVAEIRVNPREGAGSSVVDKVEFYKETGAASPVLIGQGTLVPGTNPAQYQLSYSAASHGAPGDVETYFANCVARSTQDPTKKVPSYSEPVRVRRL
jgi:CubicO group peptidase (beta-lactamase class C family)